MQIDNAANPSLRLPHLARIWVAGATLAAPALLLAVVIGQPWTDPKWMFLDALAAAEMSGDCCHVYYGFVSNLGIFLWVATSAIALFSALVFKVSGKPRDWVEFALLAGLLTGWLALDDAFLLHEIVFPIIGVPQTLVVIVYLGLAAGYLTRSWRVILAGEVWLLGAAILSLAASLGIDQVFHSIESFYVIVEDAAKFIGIVFWASFHAALLERMHAARTA